MWYNVIEISEVPIESIIIKFYSLYIIAIKVTPLSRKVSKRGKNKYKSQCSLCSIRVSYRCSRILLVCVPRDRPPARAGKSCLSISRHAGPTHSEPNITCLFCWRAFPVMLIVFPSCNTKTTFGNWNLQNKVRKLGRSLYINIKF